MSFIDLDKNHYCNNTLWAMDADVVIWYMLQKMYK